jgi:hypothetical protein
MGIPEEVIHPVHVKVPVDDPGKRMVPGDDPGQLAGIDPDPAKEP